MEQDTYSTKEAAALTGASRQVIRTYTERYSRFFSTEATPEPGQVRRFTAADLRLSRFVYVHTTEKNLTHDEVYELLERGDALPAFSWHAESAEAAQDAQERGTAALVPVERLQAAQALLQAAQRREEEAREEAEALRERIEWLQRELGQAYGELNAYKRLQPRRPRWWRWLFGGPEEG